MVQDAIDTTAHHVEGVYAISGHRPILSQTRDYISIAGQSVMRYPHWQTTTTSVCNVSHFFHEIVSFFIVLLFSVLFFLSFGHFFVVTMFRCNDPSK